MRSEVAFGRYRVPLSSFSRLCVWPLRKLSHTAGDAPNRYSNSHEWRRKLRISEKYAALR